MNLYLVRHGQANGGSADPSLSVRGIDEAWAVGKWLRDHAHAEPAAIFHSTKERARETARILAEAMPGCSAPRERTGLTPSAPVDDFAQTLLSGEEDRILVSHLPFLELLACKLLTGNAEAGMIDIPTAGVVGIERRDWKVGGQIRKRFFLDFFVTPELLRGS